ncbi:ROK family protein [Alloscardovia venturai]|uniref:ROK family protein n=1 Tax=Alloscardovia venturai TaxID=1769421 RepID=A0ABW2Y5V2_9BIFI
MARQAALNQDSLRTHNIAVVLDCLLHTSTPMSRADIARATGMTKAAISIIVGHLIEHKVIQEGQPRRLEGTGKPSSPLEFAPGTWAGLGIQVNTDGYGFTIEDFNGTALDHEWVDVSSARHDRNEIFATLERMVDTAVAKLKKRGTHIVGGGLAVPGMVSKDGELIEAPNLGWSHCNLTQVSLVKKYSLTPLNEAKLAAAAQIRGFAIRDNGDKDNKDSDKNQKCSSSEGSRPFDSFIFISTDVGIGGAVVTHGNVDFGLNGVAGEIGHVCVDFHGDVCRCGRRGCLEMYAGRRAILSAAGCENAHTLNAQESFDWLSDKIIQQDEYSLKAIYAAQNAMASAVVSAMNICDITHIVIGGFWNRFAKDWSSRLIDRILSQSNSVHRKMLLVTPPRISQHAALRGAAHYGLHRLVSQPEKFFA